VSQNIKINPFTLHKLEQNNFYYFITHAPEYYHKKLILNKDEINRMCLSVKNKQRLKLIFNMKYILCLLVVSVFCQVSAQDKRHSWGTHVSLMTSNKNFNQPLLRDMNIPAKHIHLHLNYGVQAGLLYKYDWARFDLRTGLNVVIRRMMTSSANASFSQWNNLLTYELPLILSYKIKIKEYYGIKPFIGYSFDYFKDANKVIHDYSMSDSEYYEKLYIRRSRAITGAILTGFSLYHSIPSLGLFEFTFLAHFQYMRNIYYTYDSQNIIGFRNRGISNNMSASYSTLGLTWFVR